jgi:hypothetical protein
VLRKTKNVLKRTHFAHLCQITPNFTQIFRKIKKFNTATVSLRLQPALLPSCSYPTAFSSPGLPAARPPLPAAATPVLRFRVSWFRVSDHLSGLALKLFFKSVGWLLLHAES